MQSDQQHFQIFTMVSRFQIESWLTYDFSPPPHPHGQCSWFYQVWGSTVQTQIELRNRSPNSCSSRWRVCLWHKPLIQLPGAPPIAPLLLTPASTSSQQGAVRESPFSCFCLHAACKSHFIWKRASCSSQRIFTWRLIRGLGIQPARQEEMTGCEEAGRVRRAFQSR